MKRVSAVLIAAAVLLCAALAHGAVLRATPEEIRSAADGVARTWMADEPASSLSWNWGEGVLLFGILKSYRMLGDESLLTYVEDYMQYHMDKGIRVFWSDKTTPALAAAELARRYNISTYLPLVDQVMTYVMDEAPRTQQGLIYHLGKAPLHFIPRVFPDLWVDSLFHWVPTMHRVSALTGDAAYTSEGVFQLEGFLLNMQDPVTSLLTHAYNDHPLNEQMPAYEELAFWARGNSWVYCTLVDTLAELPLEDPAYPRLQARLERLDAAIRAAQAPSGLFHTVLLNETTYEETAGSALLTYGMARGAHLGILGAETADAALRGMEGLMTVLVHEADGRVIVNGTSVGTGPRPNLYPYIPTKPQVTYGVGGWLMAAQAVLELIGA